jgi:hypothetical protein
MPIQSQREKTFHNGMHMPQWGAADALDEQAYPENHTIKKTFESQ